MTENIEKKPYYSPGGEFFADLAETLGDIYSMLGECQNDEPDQHDETLPFDMPPNPEDT